MVYASQEDKDPLEENLQGKIDYLSTEKGVQSYLEVTRLHQFVNICSGPNIFLQLQIKPHQTWNSPLEIWYTFQNLSSKIKRQLCPYPQIKQLFKLNLPPLRKL